MSRKTEKHGWNSRWALCTTLVELPRPTHLWPFFLNITRPELKLPTHYSWTSRENVGGGNTGVTSVRRRVENKTVLIDVKFLSIFTTTSKTPFWSLPHKYGWRLGENFLVRTLIPIQVHRTHVRLSGVSVYDLPTTGYNSCNRIYKAPYDVLSFRSTFRPKSERDGNPVIF